MARYEVRENAEVLSRHRTRQASLDAWRERFAGRHVEIWRTYSDGRQVLVVDGTWRVNDE